MVSRDPRLWGGEDRLPHGQGEYIRNVHNDDNIPKEGV